jgi:hypothetical protein
MMVCLKEKAAPFDAASYLSVREQREKNDDRDRNAKQPKKNASTHGMLLILLEG